MLRMAESVATMLRGASTVGPHRHGQGQVQGPLARDPLAHARAPHRHRRGHRAGGGRAAGRRSTRARASGCSGSAPRAWAPAGRTSSPSTSGTGSTRRIESATAREQSWQDVTAAVDAIRTRFGRVAGGLGRHGHRGGGAGAGPARRAVGAGRVARPPADPVAVGMGVGQADRRRRRRGRRGPAPSRGRGPRGGTGGGGRGEAGGLEGRLAVEVVHRPRRPPSALHLGGQGALLAPRRGRPPPRSGTRRAARRREWWPPSAARSVTMSPRSRRGRLARRRARWPARRAGARSAPGCRATGRPAATGRRRRSTGRRARGRGRPAPPWRAGAASGRLLEVVAGGALEAVTAEPPAPAADAWPSPSAAQVGVGVVVEEQVEPGRGAEVEQGERLVASRSSAATWHRPGSSAVQRPTSLVCVVRVAISSSSSARCSRQKSAKAAPRVPAGLVGRARARRPRCRSSAASGCSTPESRRKCTAASRRSGRRWGSGARVEEREHARRPRPRPGRWPGRSCRRRARPPWRSRGSGRPAAARRAPGQKLAGSSGLTAPKKNHSSTSMPATRRHP